MPVTINGTTGIAGVDGSAGTPAVQGTDTNTGVYFPAADTLSASTGGTERMRIDSSGNVGIGTSSPTAKLDVQGSASTYIRIKGGAGTNQGSSLYVTKAGSADTLTAFGDRANIVGGTPDQAAAIYTGPSVPFVFDVGGIERMRIDASGNVGIGTSSNLGTWGNVRIAGTGNRGLNIASEDASGANVAISAITSSDVRFNVFSNHPLIIYTNNTERMRIDASGNVLVTGAGGLGYGTGSGGTVTQATSKSTTVTLNKTNGQITMNNAALASGTAVQFIFNNSTIAATDTIIITPNFSGAVYTAFAYSVGAGSCSISVQQNSGGSRTDAVVLNFAVIKATTS